MSKECSGTGEVRGPRIPEKKKKKKKKGRSTAHQVKRDTNILFEKFKLILTGAVQPGQDTAGQGNAITNVPFSRLCDYPWSSSVNTHLAKRLVQSVRRLMKCDRTCAFAYQSSSQSWCVAESSCVVVPGLGAALEQGCPGIQYINVPQKDHHRSRMCQSHRRCAACRCRHLERLA